MNPESNLISAVCAAKDTSILVGENVDDLFTSHADIWDGIKKYYFKYQTVPDISWVEEKFRDFDSIEPKHEPRVYLDELRDHYIKSRVRNMFINQSQKLDDVGGIKVLEEIMTEVTRLNRFSDAVRDLDLTDYEAAEKRIKDRHERSLKMGGSPGIPTGFKSIDVMYPTGLAGGHLIVVIGWPGRGKTWFTAYLACKAWEQGFRPMIVSLEMSPENMADRIYTMMGSGLFRASEFSRGDVNTDEFHTWARKKFEGKGNFVVVSNEGKFDVTPALIQSKIDQHRPDIVICDYHQLFADNKNSRNEVERNKNISREFKQLAMANNIPVVDITAATMDDISDQDNPPMLSQVAWSKAIEYDADMAMAVHKQPDSDIIEVVSRKNRHGGDFAMYLDWDIDRGVIKEMHD